MKREMDSTTKWRIGCAATLYTLVLLAVLIPMYRGLFIMGSVCVGIYECANQPEPPEPQIKHAQFPFAVTCITGDDFDYFIYTDVLECDYVGWEYEPGGYRKQRAWTSSIKSGTPMTVYTAEDGTNIHLSLSYDERYLMGDEYRSGGDRIRAYLYAFDPVSGERLDDEQVYERYGLNVNMVPFMPPPIENTFGESQDASAPTKPQSSYPREYYTDEQGVLYAIDPRSNIASVVGFNGYGSIVVPQTVKGARVMSIGERAFANSYGLNEIALPDGIVSIGEGAFELCISLTGVTMENGVRTVGDHAFAYCYKLSAVTLSSRLDSIGAEAFTNCLSLTEIHIPDGVTSIASDAFDVSDVVIYAPNPMEYYGFAPEYPRNWITE